MSKIRIGYFADGPWSHMAFELLVQDPTISIEFIVPRTDSADETLYTYCKRYGIPYHKGVKINSPEFYALASGYQCDLFVSMSFNQIFKQAITQLPPLGTINCHAGKLPFYRGRNILNWALINDEKEFGITVHFIDEGIDTGDILIQKTFPISDQDNYKTLLEVSHVACATLLVESIKMLQQGTVKRIKQSSIHPVGFYCNQRMVGDEIIDWSQTSRQLFNFIRAICAPGPKAQTTVSGKLVKINNALEVPNAPDYTCSVGAIVGKTNRGFLVKTTDSVIEIFGLESEAKLKIGDRLGR
jgi:methionyl-tRNA formyltransferase